MKRILPAALAALLLAGCSSASGDENAQKQACLDALDAAEQVIELSAKGLSLGSETINILTDMLGETNPVVIGRAAERVGDISDDMYATADELNAVEYTSLAAQCRGES